MSSWTAWATVPSPRWAGRRRWAPPGHQIWTGWAGRGPLEALGAALAFDDGDLALRGNFATLGAGRRIVDRRVGRNLTSAEAHRLAEAVNSQVRVTAAPAGVIVRATAAHRCPVLFFPKEGRVSATIP